MIHVSKFHFGVCLMILSLTLISCNKNPSYKITTTEEAVELCRTRLDDARNMNDTDIECIADFMSDWSIMEDSAYNVIMKDTADGGSFLFSDIFFCLTDSIREEITRVILNNVRTIEDVISLKLLTANKRENREHVSYYKAACNYYKSLDTVRCFEDKEKTLEKYNQLLGSDPISNKEELLVFIADEDKCFQSLLNHLRNVKQKELQVISERTTSYYEELANNLSSHSDDGMREIRVYLQMRVNRRIIQNAKACYKDIQSGYNLTETQKNDYRWMVIQPFFSIDNYAMALITDSQEKDLYMLAKKLPDILARLDGFESGRKNSEEEKTLTKILVESFIKSWVKFTI